MLTGSRVIFSDNGTLIDISRSVGDLFSDSTNLPMVAAQDKLYFGCDQPFNHRFFKFGNTTNNDNPSSVSIDIWNGTEWVPAVDVIDFTATGTFTLNRAGIIQWTTDRSEGWARVNDSDDVTGLSGTHVYDMFWARMSVSADLLSTFSVAYIGQKFSDDKMLGGYYPDLVRPKLIQAFNATKSNWADQHILAAEELIRDLRKRRYVASGKQIFDWELFSIPAMHKTAHIIMNGLGPDYSDRAIDAQEAYQNELENTMAGIDRNADGHLEQSERVSAVGLVRV